MTYIIGIDPGRRGAVAALYTPPPPTEQGAELVFLWSYDVSLGVSDLAGLIRWGWGMASVVGWNGKPGRHLLVVEKPITVRGQSVQSTAAQWANYGACLSAALSLAYREDIRTPYPRTWKTALGVTSDKRTSIDKALDLYPDAPLINHGGRVPSADRAEALLLAHWGLMLYKEGKFRDGGEGCEQVDT